MSKILVTGGFGFVGGRISKKLSSKYEVVVSSRRQLDQEMLSLHGNVSQINHQKLFDKSSFPKDVQTIIHLAGLNELECVSNPSLAIRVNIDETRIILENAIENGVEQFIYFSTAHVYGSPLVGLITENSLPSPVHLYAITHKAAEDFIISAAMAKKLKGIVIRLSNSFGAPVIPSINRWTLLANDLARQAIENNVIRLHSNGCQHRDFVCLTDVENIIFEILDNNQPKFNDLIFSVKLFSG